VILKRTVPGIIIKYIYTNAQQNNVFLSDPVWEILTPFFSLDFRRLSLKLNNIHRAFCLHFEIMYIFFIVLVKTQKRHKELCHP